MSKAPKSRRKEKGPKSYRKEIALRVIQEPGGSLVLEERIGSQRMDIVMTYDRSRFFRELVLHVAKRAKTAEIRYRS